MSSVFTIFYSNLIWGKHLVHIPYLAEYRYLAHLLYLMLLYITSRGIQIVVILFNQILNKVVCKVA